MTEWLELERVRAELRDLRALAESAPRVPAVGDWEPLQEWTVITEEAYTATPASTSRITMSDTSMLKVGQGLKYNIDDTWYYGLVNAISDDAYIDVMGAPLSDDVTELQCALTTKTVQVEFFIGGASFGAISTTLLATIMSCQFRWRLAAAYLVGFSGKLAGADTTTNPKINVRLGSYSISTNDDDLGIQPTTSWVNNPLAEIDTDRYRVTPLTVVEIHCTAAAVVGDAADLSVSCIFVLE